MFETPKLAVLASRARADLVPATDAVRRSDAEVLARVHAGAVHGLYGYLDWQARQLLPISADDEEWLMRHASTWLPVPRKAAVAAVGSVTFSGTTGELVDVGVQLKDANGVTVVTTESGVIGPGGTVDVAVAAEDAGQAGNVLPLTGMTLTSPVAGIASMAMCNGLSGGAEIESLDSVRARILRRIQSNPQGGAASDYEMWALEVAGVSRAWCVTSRIIVDGVWVTTGVNVLIVGENAVPGLLADADTVARVAAHIESLRPVTADVIVMPPTDHPVDLDISLTPNTSAVRMAVQAELAMLFGTIDRGETVLLTHLSEAISRAAGETDHVLHAPVTNVAVGKFELATLGEVIWR